MLVPVRSARRITAVGLPTLTGFALWAATLAPGPRSAADELVLVPHVVREVRALVPVRAGILVYNPGPVHEQVALERLTVRAHGHVLEELALERALPGEAEFGELGAMIERLPEELSHLHRPRRSFAPKSAPAYAVSEALDRLGEIRRRVAALGAKYAAGLPTPFVQPRFTLQLDQLFFQDAAVGSEVDVELEVLWRTPSGEARSSSVTHTITWLGPRPGLPPTSAAAAAGASVHAGDLHVHSCHGEALNACAPSQDCVAETLQITGSFTYAELKSQYQALGIDWFTASDHSYCINSDSEYDVIVAEAASITDAGFVCLPDIELSSDEEGPQTGSDLGDVLCLGTTQANHMGAHGIATRKQGGDDGFLGFCDLFGDALEAFSVNAALIRAEGGYPIVNHPDATSFGWNSIADTRGIEGDQMHGVEIWSGPLQTGQGGHVATWVDWLLDGRLLYAYSGSDTHDEAFDFGANHAILAGDLGEGDLEAALKGGRVYVSNGPALVIEVELGGATLTMGDMHVLPTPTPPAPIVARVHYDFGADTGIVRVFRGVDGASAEDFLCQSGALTGAGVFDCASTLTAGANSWLRAYAENAAGSAAAYTNPVFLLPGTESVFAYCTAKTNTQGCEPSIGSEGTPSASAGSGFTISASDVINQSFGLMVYGYAADFFPFQDATLCVAQPFVRTPVRSSGGNPGPSDCSGTYSIDFNAWIASGVDPGLTAGTTVYAQWYQRDNPAPFGSGLTNALQFTIGL